MRHIVDLITADPPGRTAVTPVIKASSELCSNSSLIYEDLGKKLVFLGVPDEGIKCNIFI